MGNLGDLLLPLFLLFDMNFDSLSNLTELIIAVSLAVPLAEVAELVDALASGASGGNPVEVQVLSWAPFVT